MARPITLKYVVSFSSQDDAYSVQNLLKDGGFKKWLSHPKDRSGSLEAVFQLETSCTLSYLDIGTYWCSNISIEVGKSEWPQSRPFEPLIRNACLMTHADASLGRNVISTKMFNSNDFCSSTANRMWDRIHVICHQNYRKNVQFGLTFLRIKASKIQDSFSKDHLTEQSSKDRIESPRPMPQKIQNNYFKDNQLKSPEADKQIEKQLLKIASTSENGTDRLEGLSRTAHILIAAQKNVRKYSQNKSSKPKPKLSGKKEFFSELISQNQNPLSKREKEKAEESPNQKQTSLQNSFSKFDQKQSPTAKYHLKETDQLELLPRNAQMLMIAQENSGKYAPCKRYLTSPNSLQKSSFFSEMKAQKESFSIQEEIENFLSKLEIKPEDLDSITIADLRHRFERKKKRKLTVEERKLFVEKVSDHISKIFSENSQDSNDSDERPQTKRMRVQVPRTPSSTSLSWKSTEQNPQSTPTRLKETWCRDGEGRASSNEDLIDCDTETNHEQIDLTEPSRDKIWSKNTKLKKTIEPREVIGESSGCLENNIQFDLEFVETESTTCPLCGEIFPLDIIETHADICADSQLFDLQYSQ